MSRSVCQSSSGNLWCVLRTFATPRDVRTRKCYIMLWQLDKILLYIISKRKCSEIKFLKIWAGQRKRLTVDGQLTTDAIECEPFQNDVESDRQTERQRTKHEHRMKNIVIQYMNTSKYPKLKLKLQSILWKKKLLNEKYTKYQIKEKV